jgi:hypothetical protein
MGFAPPSAQADIVPVRLQYWPQVTVDVADAAVKEKCPVRGRIVGILGKARALGGTPHTDVVVEVLKGAVALLSTNLPVVASSALTAGGVWGSLSTVAGALDVVVDDVLAIKLIDITGGTNPTLDGLEIIVYIARS